MERNTFLGAQRRNYISRASRICNPSGDVLSHVSTPQLNNMIACSFIPVQNRCFSNSPLLAGSSLPLSDQGLLQTTMSSPKFVEQPVQPPPQPYVFTLAEFTAKLSHQVYPSIVINGTIYDINEIIQNIITNRAFSPPVDDPNPISYVCPFSFVPITCPGRGLHCKHSQCFDIPEFLIMQGPNDSEWRCPICNQPINVETISFDPFFFKPRKPEIITTRSPPPLSTSF
ncbi:MIZ zinc finger family protein [Histomonas meleagridis]|uniref:MIZ zinc finger family protein n=1 Tax=Histomonas meleagridis TaxID=135588 RepID=UPI003559FD95|nr:MIZ zinc finger family protein [Histomonas meleagridis]KAH0802935.1 MIZ zinc finger family protein [Histomonas meleagridis]